MDVSDPEIVFDQSGICNHCKAYKHLAEKRLFANEFDREKALNDVVDQIKMAGSGKEYDCLIGVSGGVDSSYVALKVKELGLRPLAVHLDNGWDSELAVQNIENIVKKLNIDLWTHVVDWEEFKDIQLSYFRASVIDIELPTDHAITAIMYKIAYKFGIKTIIDGCNHTSEGILPGSWISDKLDSKNLLCIHKAFGKQKIKTYPYITFLQYYFLRLICGINQVSILDYLSYDKEKAKEEIAEKLDWRDYGSKHGESFFTRIYQNYILPEKFGVDKRRAHFSTLICSGQLSREMALEMLEAPLYSSGRQLEWDKAYLLKKWGLSGEEFSETMSLRPVHYSEYPTYRGAFWYRIMKNIYRKRKGSR